jgi:uncharacterized protein (DUF2236 family)
MSMARVECVKNLALDAIGAQVRSIAGSESSLEDFRAPAGDKGLFGPDSMAWRVHAHFTSMMVGGLSSLIIQALHPRALAAVWDHSNFRQNLKSRLGRTAYFVAATTYGGEALAMESIRRVNAIHAGIRGHDQEGRPYVANDPDLVRWVHLVEVTSFLSAYQHLSVVPLSHRACDQYIAEMTQVGHLLGAVDLPQDWTATHSALLDYHAVLKFDDRAKEILRVVEAYPVQGVDKPIMALVLQSAMDIMPAWALTLIHRDAGCLAGQTARRCALQLASYPIQWTLDDRGVSAVARQRVHSDGIRAPQSRP